MRCPAFHYIFTSFSATKEHAASIHFGKDTFSLCISHCVHYSVIKLIWNSHVQSNRGNLSQSYALSYGHNRVHIIQADYYVITEMFLFKWNSVFFLKTGRLLKDYFNCNICSHIQILKGRREKKVLLNYLGLLLFFFFSQSKPQQSIKEKANVKPEQLL